MNIHVNRSKMSLLAFAAAFLIAAPVRAAEGDKTEPEKSRFSLLFEKRDKDLVTEADEELIQEAAEKQAATNKRAIKDLFRQTAIRLAEKAQEGVNTNANNIATNSNAITANANNIAVNQAGIGLVNKRIDQKEALRRAVIAQSQQRKHTMETNNIPLTLEVLAGLQGIGDGVSPLTPTQHQQAFGGQGGSTGQTVTPAGTSQQGNVTVAGSTAQVNQGYTGEMQNWIPAATQPHPSIVTRQWLNYYGQGGRSNGSVNSQIKVNNQKNPPSGNLYIGETPEDTKGYTPYEPGTILSWVPNGMVNLVNSKGKTVTFDSFTVSPLEGGVSYDAMFLTSTPIKARKQPYKVYYTTPGDVTFATGSTFFNLGVEPVVYGPDNSEQEAQAGPTLGGFSSGLNILGNTVTGGDTHKAKAPSGRSFIWSFPDAAEGNTANKQ